MAIAKSLTLLMKLKTDDFQQGLKGAERQADRSARDIERSGEKAKKSWQDVGTAVASLKGIFAGFVTAAFFKQVADAVAGNEKIISSFRAITDNAEQARAVFDTFNNLSRELPQSFDEIRQSVLTLGKSGIMPTTDLIKDLSNMSLELALPFWCLPLILLPVPCCECGLLVLGPCRVICSTECA